MLYCVDASPMPHGKATNSREAVARVRGRRTARSAIILSDQANVLRALTQVDEAMAVGTSLAAVRRAFLASRH